MNNFTKKLPLVVSIVSALSFAAVTVHQSDIIKELRVDLKQTFSKLTLTQGLLKEEMALTETLRIEKAVLEDSIEVLHVEIATLNDKIAEQKSTIHSLNLRVKKLEDNVASFSSQITEMRKKADVDNQQLKALEAERDHALQQMVEFDRERAKMMAEVSKAEKEQAAERQRLQDAQHRQEKVETRLQQSMEVPRPRTERPAPKPQPLPQPSLEPAPAGPSMKAELDAAITDQVQERIHKVVTATNVEYTSVQLKMQEGGSALNKLKKNGWRYTTINLNLTNPDANALVDEEFIIQVFDLDNNQVVPMNESNPQYPGSSQGAIGYRFTYTGQPMTLQYFNSQQKTGSNYELRIFYSKNNVLLPIKNGTRRIVENGVVAG